MYWRRLIPARRHPPAEGYNLISFTILSWKGATTPCSHLPASPRREIQTLLLFTSLSWKGATTPCSRLPTSPGRELLPPALVYQLPLEGSYNPLTENFNPQHHCGPRFITFQTGSTSFHMTYLAGHQIYSFSTLTLVLRDFVCRSNQRFIIVRSLYPWVHRRFRFIS